MIKKALLILLLLGSFNFSCQAMQNLLKKGDECSIVSGYLKNTLPGDDDVIIIDEAHNMQDLISFFISEKYNYGGADISLSLLEYISICILNKDAQPHVCQNTVPHIASCLVQIERIDKDCRGVFYSGKLKKSRTQYYLHPSWLKKIEQNS